MREAALQLPRSVQQEGRRCSRQAAAVPLQSVERPLVEQAVPLQPMGPTWSRSPRCSPPMGGGAPGGAGGCGLEEAAAHGEPPQEQALGQSCSPWRGAHAGAGGLGGAAARGGPVLEQFAPGGWTPWYRAMWEQFLKSCCLWAAPTGSVGEGWYPMGGAHVEQGQIVTVKEKWR